MKRLTFIMLLFCSTAMAQGNIAQFSVWNPKSANFEAGYKRHLTWHTSNKETWNWYGWYIVSGPRFGQFVDATFDHTWSQFDHSINPSGDEADNALHTDPFGDYLKQYKVAMLPFSDPQDGPVLRSNYLRMFTITVNNINQGVRIVEKAKSAYKQKNSGSNLLVFRMVDGGDVQQLIVLLGCRDYNDFGTTTELQDYLAAADDKANVITNITAETLKFAEDMSINIR